MQLSWFATFFPIQDIMDFKLGIENRRGKRKPNYVSGGRSTCSKWAPVGWAWSAAAAAGPHRAARWPATMYRIRIGGKRWMPRSIIGSRRGLPLQWEGRAVLAPARSQPQITHRRRLEPRLTGSETVPQLWPPNRWEQGRPWEGRGRRIPKLHRRRRASEMPVC
jgi:hypothetical protein